MVKYEPETVDTDGFGSAIKAWTSLFVKTVLIRCFLHGYLKMRSGAGRLSIFDAETVSDFGLYFVSFASGLSN